jgi:hypothetical protein
MTEVTPATAVQYPAATPRTLIRDASNPAATQAEQGALVTELLQPENIKQVVHLLTTARLPDRELARQTLSAIQPPHIQRFVINTIQTRTAKPESMFERVADTLLSLLHTASVVGSVGQVLAAILFEVSHVGVPGGYSPYLASLFASLGWMSLEYVASGTMALLECHLESVTGENDQAVADALGDGTIRLLKPEYVLAAKEALPRCQDLPSEAFLAPEDAREAYLSGRREVGSVSYRWRFEQNPDLDGEQLKQLQKMLRFEPKNYYLRPVEDSQFVWRALEVA